MQITIDIPDEITEQLTETPDQLQRHLLELLSKETLESDRFPG
ncbi:hypothetical protein [Coleofasciculus sp.]